MLTLGVPEAADKNDVAKALSGVTVKIGDNFKFASNVTTAVFYPVFDYVEDDGENQNLTLELYSRNGTFAYPLTKNMFELGDDFTGGQVLSVTRTSDTVAELKISVPANNQTVDDLDKTGTITANAGVLVNEWGEVTDEACGYTRRYTQDSLGRDLTAPDIDTIKGIVGGFGNTALGTITSVASGVTGGLEAVMTILDLTGIVPNKTSQTLTLLKQVADNVQTVLDLMNRQIEIMRDVQSQTYKLQLSDFDAKLATLNDRNGRLATYYGYAKTDLGIDPDSETKPYPTADDMKDLGKMKELAAKIVAHCKEEEAKGTNKYLNFTKNFNELVTAYGDVAVKATLPSDENPMGVFDKFCTLTYNFDTSTYEARTAQRLDIEYALKEGFLNIALYYGCEFTEGEINPDLQSAKTHLVAFENLINEDTSEGKQKGAFAVVKNTSSGAYSYVLNMNLKRSLTCFTHEGTCVVDNVGTNFDADQEKNFVTRMQGRTMAEELDLAGFDYSLIKGATIGMPLKNWSEKDGAWSFGDVRKFKHWYSDVIKWNDTKVSSKVKTCYEWKWQSYATVGLWTKV